MAQSIEDIKEKLDELRKLIEVMHADLRQHGVTISLEGSSKSKHITLIKTSQGITVDDSKGRHIKARL